MANSYAGLCDDFYINMRLGTYLKLTAERGTLVNFFERIQRAYPKLANFFVDETAGENCLQEERVEGTWRWLRVGAKRLAAGHVNPPDSQDAYAFCKSILEAAPHYLDLGTVDLEYIDMLWGFDFDYKGNHHELVAEALIAETPMGKLMEAPHAKGVKFDLFGIVGLSEDARLQARVSVEPRTTAAQVRTGDYPEQPLSVCVVVRQWSGGTALPELAAVQGNLIDAGEKFIAEHIVGPFLTPVREAIARRR